MPPRICNIVNKSIQHSLRKVNKKTQKRHASVCSIFITVLDRIELNGYSQRRARVVCGNFAVAVNIGKEELDSRENIELDGGTKNGARVVYGRCRVLSESRPFAYLFFRAGTRVSAVGKNTFIVLLTGKKGM